MKSNYSLALMAATGVLLITTAPLRASDNNAHTESLFRAQETSVDLFGTVSVGQETINHIAGNRVRKDGRLGAGVGMNYFLTRNLGIGAEAYSENTRHSFVDNASGNLIFRIPIDTLHLAPYLYGGGGYQFDTAERFFGQAGAGVEFRFTKCCGIFADARYVIPDGTKKYGVGRAGIRLSF